MSYANSMKIPYVVIIGQNELETGKLTIKNMETGEENNVAHNILVENP